MINPAVQERTQDLYLRMISHPISEEYLPSALMKFYTGKIYKTSLLFLEIHIFMIWISLYSFIHVPKIELYIRVAWFLNLSS